MKDIAIYGAGGLGREVVALIEAINQDSSQWNLIGFFDDGKAIGEQISNFGKVLGGMNELNSWKESLCIVLAFGSPNTVRAIRNKIKNQHISFPNLIHPSFFIGDTSTFFIGEGNIIQRNCAVTTSVTIGNFNLLNGSVGFGHDATIGDFNTFMPGCNVSGEVTIGNENLFGAMSFVKQGIRIGNNITLGPLSPLLIKPKDGCTYIGNPAKLFKF